MTSEREEMLAAINDVELALSGLEIDSIIRLFENADNSVMVRVPLGALRQLGHCYPALNKIVNDPPVDPHPNPPPDAMREELDGETIQILLDLLNPLHGELDRQTYDAKDAMDFDMPPDYAHDDISITAQMERDLTQAVLILERRRAALSQANEVKG